MASFAGGATVGLFGGMIRLGGAEFRLPLRIGLFGFVAFQAVIVNKAMRLGYWPPPSGAASPLSLSPTWCRTGRFASTYWPAAWLAPGLGLPGPLGCEPPR